MSERLVRTNNAYTHARARALSRLVSKQRTNVTFCASTIHASGYMCVFAGSSDVATTTLKSISSMFWFRIIVVGVVVVVVVVVVVFCVRVFVCVCVCVCWLATHPNA